MSRVTQPPFSKTNQPATRLPLPGRSAAEARKALFPALEAYRLGKHK